MSDDADSEDADDARDALAWETTDSDVAYDCPGFDVVHEDVVLPDGTESDFDYLDEAPSVVVLPLTPQGDVVVIEEWRQAVKRVNRGLPAGGVEDADADLADAAHRELTEETGYEAERVKKLASFEPTNGVANAHHHYFVAYGCTPSGEQELDFNESIRVEETTRDALRGALRRDDLRDGRAALALLYYEAFGPEAEFRA
ncbi:NUDIX hydrolase [Halarchaeum sp. CBA1220]|uniref:NUDIX hydrolase n=1 Tax=Halarchaeum sp. CBA1220 TaxID=1853682 RepID=UPI000F3A9344|nr:NUDIX hydrolase [Halarchaeum sp. CBA1220]QLC33077.1 NUDIX hydrolase [Halarchaeum sp. CBA1220]